MTARVPVTMGEVGPVPLPGEPFRLAASFAASSSSRVVSGRGAAAGGATGGAGSGEPHISQKDTRGALSKVHAGHC